MHFQERPWDLFLSEGYVVAMASLVVATGQGLLLAVLLVFLIPGYVLVAALFPGNAELDWVERIALSLALSIVVVPLLGLILNFTALGIRLIPVVLSVLGFSLALGFVAYRRRMNLPPDKRLAATLEFAKPTWGEYSKAEKALTAGLVVALLVSVSVLAYVVATPRPGERFTEFYLLGPEGEAANYPSNLNVSETGSLIVGVSNHEFEPVEYTIQVDLVGVELVWDEAGGFNRTVDLNRTNLAWYNLSLDHDGTWTTSLTVGPGAPGLWQVRLLLFRDGDLSTVYRNLHLFVTVGAS